MHFGERAALEGVLSVVNPSLAIEIGTAEGGSLERISAHAEEVHALDLERHPSLTAERFPNVTYHIGDSHKLLPRLLHEFSEVGRNVDFVLVDGDHSAAGARADLEDLISSPSTSQTVILIHDTLNERVRAGVEQGNLEGSKKVKLFDLDFVPGRIYRTGPLENELWCGFGIVVTGWELPSIDPLGATYDTPEMADALLHDRSDEWGHRSPYREVMRLERQVASLRSRIEAIERTLSWRLTAPLRGARQRVRSALQPPSSPPRSS
jgi:hypothetical protein